MKEVVYLILNVLVGLPGSGKSTYCCNQENSDFIVLSSDEIRKKYSLDPNNTNDNIRCFNILNKELFRLLNLGENVIYDTTNVSSERRIGLINTVKQNVTSENLHIISTLFATPFEECCRRVKLRNLNDINFMGSEVVEKFYKQFECPNVFEGFERISIIYSDNSKGSKTYNSYELQNIKHETPYHLETVGEHCDMVERLMFESLTSLDIPETDQRLLLESSRLHDIGKKYTKFFKNNEITAHYYNHENVGSYDSLFFDSPDDLYTLERSFLVGWHMRSYRWENKGVIDKYRNLLGDRLFGYLQKIHELDDKGRIKEV